MVVGYLRLASLTLLYFSSVQDHKKQGSDQAKEPRQELEEELTLPPTGYQQVDIHLLNYGCLLSFEASSSYNRLNSKSKLDWNLTDGGGEGSPDINI